MDVKTLCLGVLYQGDASGYEIKKAFQEGPFSHFQDASFGSIYPALGKLTRDELVECTQMAQENRPDKKVYGLTAKGRDSLITSLLAPPAPDRVTSDFFFILYFADLLPKPQVAHLIEQRIAYYQNCIDRMSECDLSERKPGQRLCHGLGMSMYQAALDYLKGNKAQILAELDGETSQTTGAPAATKTTTSAAPLKQAQSS